MGLVHGSISDKIGGFAAIVPSRFIKEMGSLKEGNGTLYIYDENSKLVEIREYVDGRLEGLDPSEIDYNSVFGSLANYRLRHPAETFVKTQRTI